MTDKVQKIREEVENLKEWQPIATPSLNKLLSLLDTMQEEPVSIWHNMDEVPIKGEVIVVHTKDTFYGLSIQKGGTTYKNKNKDRYVRWAYASDLLNLSNVQRTVKNWEEPVSEELKEAANAYISNENNYSQSRTDTFKAGAQWQKQQMKEALRTEYEKGRHDALEEMPKWKPAARAYLGDRLPRIDRSLDRLVARIGESEIAYYLKIEDLYKLPKEE